MRHCFFAAVFVVVLGQTSLEAEEIRSIEVSARSEVRIAPDIVHIHFTLRQEDEDLLVAKAKNDAVYHGLTEIHQHYGVKDDAITVTDFDVYPIYPKYGRKYVEPIAYRVQRHVEVQFTDFSKLDQFVTDALAAGAESVHRVDFRLKTQRLVQFEARRLAVDYAREKATHLAELTGMKVGLPIRIDEGIEYNMDSNAFGGFAGGIAQRQEIDSPKRVDQNSQQNVIRFAALQDSAEAKSEDEDQAPKLDDELRQKLIPPGEIAVNAHVTIRYEMMPADAD